jgi:hypothetical protein
MLRLLGYNELENIWRQADVASVKIKGWKDEEIDEKPQAD